MPHPVPLCPAREATRHVSDGSAQCRQPDVASHCFPSSRSNLLRQKDVEQAMVSEAPVLGSLHIYTLRRKGERCGLLSRRPRGGTIVPSTACKYVAEWRGRVSRVVPGKMHL